jgi:hypothetical protein
MVTAETAAPPDVAEKLAVPVDVEVRVTVSAEVVGLP